MDAHRIKFCNIPVMKIGELLTAGRKSYTRLQSLLDQAAGQDAWTRELRAVLPESLGRHCRVIAIRGNVLVVACADGAIATRLRFLAPSLIEKLKVLSHYRQIERFEIGISRSGEAP